VAAGLVLVAALLAGCGSASDRASTATTTAPQVEPVTATHRGEFLVECAFSHRAKDDPIVFPGQPGQSHSHEFFGNTSTDADSTLRSLRAAGTSCRLDQDKAAYWVPTLFRGDEPLTPLGAKAYYRPAIGGDADEVQPYPEGLKMLAGDAHTTSAQPTSIVGWTCGDRPGDNPGDLQPTIPTCSPDLPISLQLNFPDCWDGHNLDSEDHRSHVAYSRKGICPDSHPVNMPQLLLIVRWNVGGDSSHLRLASGGQITAHGDFMNAWDPARLDEEVRVCLRRNVYCGTGVTGGLQQGTPP
jgi:hypothetical protein